MHRDLHGNIKLVPLLLAAQYSATTTSGSVDCMGFGSLELALSIGEVSNAGTGSWAFKLQESDDDTTFTDIVNSDVCLHESALDPLTAPDSVTGVFLEVDHADEDDATYRIGYIGHKRYVRVVATAASTPGNTPMSIVSILGHPDLAPTAD